MAKVTVYRFTVYDKKKDYHPVAKGMVTEQSALNIQGASIIQNEFLEVDESVLTGTGRYYESDGESNE